ncbi:MAG: hypothetical protein ACRCZS_02415 [Chroococcidiopsis sp.]
MEEIVSLKSLQQKLGKSSNFSRGLKVHSYAVLSRNKRIAYLLPPTTEGYQIIQYIALSQFRSEIGFYLNQLKKFKSEKPSAIGLLDGGSDVLSLFVIDAPTSKSLNC